MLAIEDTQVVCMSWPHEECCNQQRGSYIFTKECFQNLGWILIRGVAGSYGSSLLHFFLRSLHTVFHSGCTNSCSYQQCMRIAFSTQPLQLLLFLVLFIIAILTFLRWQYPIVVLIGVSCIISEVEHLSIQLLAICRCSWKKCLFRSFANVLIGFFWC